MVWRMTLEERVKQLRQIEKKLPQTLRQAGMNATLRAIQKAVESTRVSPEHKAYLRTLKVKSPPQPAL